MSARSPIDTAAQVVSGGFILLFGLPFTLAGLFIFYQGFAQWQLHNESKTWVEVPAHIQSAELSVTGTGKNRATRLKTSYWYEYQGKQHTSVQVGLETAGGGADASQSRERFAVLDAARKSGKPVTARVNPHAPERALLFRDPGSFAYVAAPFGLVFTLVGLSLQFGGLYSVLDAVRRRQRAARFPDRPWRVAGMWDGFIIQSGSPGSVVAGWVVALGTVSFMLVFVIAMSVEKNVPLFPKLIVAVTSLIPLLILTAVIYYTIRVLKYGTVRLVLAKMPIAPGGPLDAEIHVDRRVAADRVTLKLTCTESERIGKTTRKKELHAQTQEVRVDRPPQGGARIRVSLGVPGGARPREEGDLTVRWCLEASADTPGVDFAATFDDLPVYAVADPALIETNPNR